MKVTKTCRPVYFLLSLLLVISNLMGSIGTMDVFAEGTGTWDNPYTIAEAIAIQDSRIATVEGYIVGQPTAASTVIKSNFPNDYAFALADNSSETGTGIMLYVQIAASFRPDFGLKTKPDNMGKRVRVTGKLTPYFSPHPGLKEITAAQFVGDTPSEDTTPPLITHTPLATATAGIPIHISAAIDDASTVTAAVYYGNDAASLAFSAAMGLGENSQYSSDIPGQPSGNLFYYIEASDGANTATLPADKTNPFQIIISDADAAGPVITDTVPAAGVFTGNELRPVISAKYSDPSGIDVSSVNLFLDTNNITSSAAVTDSGVTYTPSVDMATGSHSVKLEVSDTKGNKSEKAWTFNVGEETFSLYFGQLHAHSNLSDGQGTPSEAFAWARDTAKADFFALTDHSNSFDNDKGSGNISDWNSSTSAEWKLLNQTADSYNEAGKFAAIAGYEMSWSGSTGGWGHINTFNTDWFESRNNSSMDLKAYYIKLSADTSSISQFNHPGNTFGDFADFGYYSAAADDSINLIEVGNGEGPVRGSGYFPSYEYYTRALDKGWHLAPSNNQDNHMAGWITSNEARTVVMASSLTRESIYDAIDKMRVYATEDSNLSINYEVNGSPMGTILDSPESLDFNISFSDQDSADSISKVSIITEGGEVAAMKEFDSSSGEWEFQLTPQYKYYYVRIDQADQDIAVTAPIWTDEVVPVGISKVEASQDPAIINTPVSISATVYNNSALPLSGVAVEFYKNEISAETKLGEAVTADINAGGTGTAAIEWVPEQAGSYIIYAKAVINVGGQDRVFTQNISIDAENEEDVVKIVIDAGHCNQYVNGDYAGKILTLKSMLKEKKYLAIENTDELTAEDLEGVKLLVITDPQSKDDTKYKLQRSIYTDAEVEVIRQYMNNGGALIITSRADYNDKGVTDLQYQSAAQGNKILEAIGSNIRFNDDEVIDKTSNGGQEFRLYFDEYESPKYMLTEDITPGLTYSFYSGCSVVLKAEGSEAGIDWLVKGHDTTETLDSDLQSDSTPVSKGDVRALGAEVLNNGSKLIVAGTAFFSDFETASSDNGYSNKQLTSSIIDWMVQPKPVELKTIAEVRADSDMDGKPDLLGRKFAVEGRVTAQSVGMGTNNAFFDVIYVQDATGGITVFGVSSKQVPLGALVKVTGRVDQYDGDTELQLSNEDTDVEITDSNIVLVEPMTLSTGSSMLEENEGMLVKVKGIVTRMTDNSLYLDDGSGEARIYVNGYIGDGTDNALMLGKWDKNIAVGDTVCAIGLASQDAEGHRLRVRNTAEIVRIYIPITKFKLDKNVVKMRVHETIKLTCRIEPVNATNKQLVWTSSNSSVATVENGVVTLLKMGTAVITVRTVDGKYSASCTIKIKKGITY